MSAEEKLLRISQGWLGEGPVDLIQLCLFDWAACALAGKDEPVAQILARQSGIEGNASVVGGGKTSAADAALINGSTGHALDYDDTHFDHLGHTSAVIMPAVLALAEDQSITSTAQILEAALVGSEAAVRIGLWLGRDHYQVGFHQTATSGAIGAVVAGARLLQLNETQTRHAIGLVATGASGLKGQFGTMGKPLNAGLAARSGVESTLWAQAGLTADANGVTQFGATHHGQSNECAWSEDAPWKIARISHKFHACCHGLHAMLEALREINGPVVELNVQTHPRWMTVCNNPSPATGLECKFSYAMTAAMTVSGVDTAVIASFSDSTATDAKLIAVRDTVKVTPDETLSEMQSRVDVTYADETTATFFHDLSAPLDMKTRETRVRAKADALIGGQAAALWDAIQSEDISPIMDVLRG
ncbi:MAG TPA: 2-methylcitrate dehydratase [Octadecabacter sp.]|nr:2-methylcitrate dehydratase [Octadecabacter sp.]